MHTETIRFTSSDGDQLAARLELPADRKPHAFALFAHCFTCTKNIKAAVNVSRSLAGEGFGVLRFDFTGLGESEGDFADTNFSSNVQDLLAAAAYLEREWGAPSLLVGHSLGGSAVLKAAVELPSVEAVATIGSPSDPGHVLSHFSTVEEAIEREGEAEVTLAGRPFTVRRQFLEDVREVSLAPVVEGLKRALLIFHSPIDETVSIDHAANLYGWAKHPKSFVSLDEADHLLSDERDSRYVGKVLAAWASRYLPPPERSETLEEIRTRDRVATYTGSSGYRTEIAAGKHSLAADEPRSVGGTDTAPTPYDLLLAGLGSCTGMTLRMYADRKKWPLDGITVRLKHSKVHAEDCDEDCKGGNAKLDRIDRELVLDGDLDDDQLTRLLEIADRCPVHRTLESHVVIETALEER